MTTKAFGTTPPDFESDRLMLPAVIESNESRVRRSFWSKIRRVAGRIPFAEDATAMYFCTIDPATPLKVRATVLAALAYFVIPTDLIPDFLAGMGFADDATVIATALSLVAGHITSAHRKKAREALGIRGASAKQGKAPGRS